jgi:hypothetical protein
MTDTFILTGEEVGSDAPGVDLLTQRLAVEHITRKLGVNKPCKTKPFKAKSLKTKPFTNAPKRPCLMHMPSPSEPPALLKL